MNAIDADAAISPTQDAAKPRLWTRGFVALLITQFMGALNDNIFRWLIIPIGKCAVGWADKPDAIRTIGALVFLVPFLLWTAYAGYFCDRFNRRNVLVGSKIAELLIMILGTVAIVSQSVPFMLLTLFLMASQSAFFSPAKYGSLPDLVPFSRISEANGYVSTTTMIACVGGQLLGGVLFVWTTLNPESPAEGTGGLNHWAIWASVIIGVSAIGMISSFFIPSIKAADPSAKFPLNPFSQTFYDLRALFRHRFLFWTATASAFFWGLGALAQINIDKFGTEFLLVRQDYATALAVALSLGIGVGAFVAGKWSKNRLEFGLVPLGAAFMVVFCVVLGLTPNGVAADGASVASPLSFPYLFAAVALVGLGLSAGLYDLPLVTALQTESPEKSRGRILAAYNFYSFAAMAVFSVFQGVLTSPLFGKGTPLEDGAVARAGLDAAQIWLFCGLISVPVLIATTKAFAMPFLRFCVGAALRLVYNPRIDAVDRIPENGPALLVGNHVSYLDALLLYCAAGRPIRFVADRDFLPKKSKLANFVIRKTGVVQIAPGERRSIVAMLKETRAAFEKGELVCIFAEGALTRVGQVRRFAPGFLGALRGSEDAVPVVPFAISGFYGSRWGYAKPASFKTKSHYRPAVSFGEPFNVGAAKAAGQSDAQISQRLLHIVQELEVDATSYRLHPNDCRLLPPPRKMIRGCRMNKKRIRFADSTGKEATGAQALLQALVLRRVLRRTLGSDRFVGVLLPTSVFGVLANGALGLDRRIPVNLNYTLTNDILNYCAKKVGITKVITSKKLLAKLPKLALDAELVVLEDLARSIKTSDKLLGFLDSLTPTWLLERKLGLTKEKLSDLNTVVFTSGSTGMPKGVMLTNGNVAANMQSFAQKALPTGKDALFGTLPFFHSFGYTTTIWFPLCYPYPCYYHFNPLDYRGVAEVSRKYKPTIFPTTPTFLRTYLRRCEKEDFAHIDFVVPGAEKTPKDLADGWLEKFGVELSEGYGATEMAPVMSVNLPSNRAPDPFTPYRKFGSIGQTSANFVAKVIDQTTGEEAPPNVPGMLIVKSNSITDGYYDDPERSAKVLRDGWYITGDIAKIDEDDFVFITGRETRMSKIGGEMAPHGLIEERLNEAIRALEQENDAAEAQSLGENEKSNELRLVVTAVPDEKKGEKLVALYVSLPESVSLDAICKRAAELGLPQLWIPTTVNFKKVDAIPILGTGKLDLKGVKDLALRLYGLQD